MKRSVLVTGGSRGIGAAIAKCFREHGHEVSTPTREELDLASSAAVEDYIRRHAGQEIDVLVNNAGINVLNGVAEIDSSANALCAGFVDSDLTRQNNSASEIEAIAAAIPVRRLAQPDELARVAYFLGSDDNTYMTGQAVVADGGFLCQ